MEENFAPIISPILRKLVVFWNNRQWEEDLPIKLRRQKDLRGGSKILKDFLTVLLADHREGSLECQFPLPRFKNSPQNVPDVLL